MKTVNALAILVRFTESRSGGNYLHAEVSFVKDAQDPHNAERPFSFLDSYGERGWQALCVTGQAHCGLDYQGAPQKPSDDFYGWDQFQIGKGSSVNETQAEDALEAVKAIRKALAKMEANEGRCENFGQFVNRLARAVKTKKVWCEGWKSKTEYGPYSSHQLGNVASDVKYRLANWVMKNEPNIVPSEALQA